MKNLIKFFMVLAVLCAVTACSQTFESVNNNIKSQEKAKGRLVMNVGSQSRTIMPDVSIEESDIKSATLTANGTEIGNWSGEDIISQLESDNSILLDVGSYNFEMVFCSKNEDVILIGAINNQEIKVGDNSLTFDMKIPTTGKGNIVIGLSWEAISGISKIKAGLYHIATGEAVTGYEAEQLTINGTLAIYSKNNVPTGQYIIKFEIYDATDKVLNTLTDVIKVIGGKTTSDQKILSKINTQYTITYDLAGGSWKADFTPVAIRNANTGIILPTSENIEKTNYILAGWYDENGDKVTQIPSDTAENITITARWGLTEEAAIKVITELSGDEPYDIVIAGEITSDTIAAIKTALQNNSSAKVSLDLSGTTGLTTIDGEAFKDCDNLISITIPDSVISIGENAFYGCDGLTTVTIPDSVTGIGKDAFAECNNIENVYISDLEAWCNIVFEGNAFANPLSNGAKLYLNDNLVKDLVIPDSVTSLNFAAFFGCESLENVTIPDSVTTIGKSAFNGCSNLTNVTIPDSVTSIGDYVFNGCSSLTSVEIPNGVTKIGEGMFQKCSSLESVVIPDGVTTIGKSAFNGCSNLTNVTIPDSVTTIGDYVFNGCSSLTSVEIPNGVTKIGEGMFQKCSSLENVVIPDSVTSIGIYAFYGCSSLENVTIPDGVTTIGKSVFYSCSSLESVVIPDGVTSIGDYAFNRCSNLTNVTIPDSVASIGISAFYGCDSLTSVYIFDLDAWENIEFSNYSSNPLYDGANLYLNGSLAKFTITYNLNGGSWKSGFTPVTERNANAGITLPTADNIKKTNYTFIGWYDENGDKVTQIPSDTSKNITVTAKWWYSVNFVYVQGATITGAITANGYTTSGVFKDGGTVTVGDFYMCDHEVTQAEYEKYCRYTGDDSPSSTYGDGSNYPAYYVSWYDALVYCNKRSIAEGLTPCYTISGSIDPSKWGTVPTSSNSTWNAAICDFTANGYRLPKDSEWEYAARGGNGLAGYQYEYAGSDTIDDVAWYIDNSSIKTHTVKGKKANKLGLYDMSGNVWEWCWDAYSGGNRFHRGGCWRYDADLCSFFYRFYCYAYNREYISGFRVVRTAE